MVYIFVNFNFVRSSHFHRTSLYTSQIKYINKNLAIIFNARKKYRFFLRFSVKITKIQDKNNLLDLKL
jgi:hypothetical protein